MGILSPKWDVAIKFRGSGNSVEEEVKSGTEDTQEARLSTQNTAGTLINSVGSGMRWPSMGLHHGGLGLKGEVDTFQPSPRSYLQLITTCQ